VIGPLLNKKAKEIDEYYKERHGAQTVSQIRDFMKRFGAAQQEHQSLKIHTGIAENILGITKDPAFHKRIESEQTLLAGLDPCSEYIEDCIGRSEPFIKVMRLLILHSLTNGGIKPKVLEYFKNELLQTYGYEYLLSINNIEKLGLIKKQEGKNFYTNLRKGLNLVMEDIDENNPNDISYVYSGYAPISVRLVQNAIKPGWRAIRDFLAMLPGPTVEETQALPAALSQPKANPNPVTLVVIIGGITYSEIAALRFLTKLEGYGDILIATTKLINGDSLLNTFMENLGILPTAAATPTPIPTTTTTAPAATRKNK